MVKKLLIPIILAIVLICGIVLIVWNPFTTRSSLVIENAITKLSQLKAFKTETNIAVEIWAKPRTNEEQTQKIDALLTISTDSNDLGTEEAKTLSEIDFKLGIEGIEINLKGKIIGAGEKLYLKITTLPSIPLLGEALEEIKNQWIEIDIADLREKLGEVSIEGTIETNELINDLKEAMKEKNIFKVKKEFAADEELNGVKTTHYLTELNKKTAKGLIPEILELNKKYLSEQEKANYEKEVEEFLKSFNKNFEDIWNKIKPLNFEFWLRKKDSSLYRIAFEKEITSDIFEMKEIDKIELSIDFTFSDFNKKVDIEIPEDVKLIEEVFPFVIPENLLE